MSAPEMSDQISPPTAMRRLGTPGAAELAGLSAMFEDLQTVLRCCERLVTDLGTVDGGEPNGVVVEAVWTTALLSYARCFVAAKARPALTDKDLTAAQPEGDVLKWHQVVLRLRDHYADPTVNPRERFSVGVAQDESGAASGLGHHLRPATARR